MAEHVYIGVKTVCSWGKGVFAPFAVTKSLITSSAASSALDKAGVVFEAAEALTAMPQQRACLPRVDNLEKPRILA